MVIVYCATETKKPRYKNSSQCVIVKWREGHIPIFNFLDCPAKFDAILQNGSNILNSDLNQAELKRTGCFHLEGINYMHK